MMTHDSHYSFSSVRSSTSEKLLLPSQKDLVLPGELWKPSSCENSRGQTTHETNKVNYETKLCRQRLTLDIWNKSSQSVTLSKGYRPSSSPPVHGAKEPLSQAQTQLRPDRPDPETCDQASECGGTRAKGKLGQREKKTSIYPKVDFLGMWDSSWELSIKWPNLSPLK